MSAFRKDLENLVLGPGRPKGPQKVRIQAYVLPETAAELRKRAFKSFSLGSVLDWLLRKRKV